MQIQMLGPKMGDYSLVTAGLPADAGNPFQLGVINGGIYPREKDVHY